MSETADRSHYALLDALDTLVEFWHGAHHPPRRPGGKQTGKPTSRPPVPVGTLSTLDAAWRDLRSWAQLIMEERDLTVGPRTPEGPDLALFIARHADWLARHVAAEDAWHELARHARLVRDLAKGNVTRRVEVGQCPELVVTDPDNPVIHPCKGSLVAVIHYADDVLPAAVRCSEDREHAWTAGQWTTLGRKLGRSIGSEVTEIADRVGTRVVHVSGAS